MSHTDRQEFPVLFDLLDVIKQRDIPCNVLLLKKSLVPFVEIRSATTAR